MFLLWLIFLRAGLDYRARIGVRFKPVNIARIIIVVLSLAVLLAAVLTSLDSHAVYAVLPPLGFLIAFIISSGAVQYADEVRPFPFRSLLAARAPPVS